MELNEVAIGCIESDYLKHYLLDCKHTFSSEEQLIIIHNCRKTLAEKIEIYKLYLENSDEVGKELAKGLIVEAVSILDLVNNHNYAAVVYRSKHNKYTAIDSLKALQTVVESGSDDLESEILTVSDLHNGVKLLDIRLNADLEIINYIYHIEQTMNMDKYINIPNDITIGDVVKIHNDINESEYIVVSNSLLPNRLKEESSYSSDVSISVVRKDMLHTYKPYKQQIENILRKRISRIDGKGQSIDSDMIYKEHEKFHLTCIEKIQSEE